MNDSQVSTGDIAKQAPEANPEDHCIQVELLDAAITALSEGNHQKHLLMEQLHIFTQVHFTSEQLLMRLKQHPDYEHHARQHDTLLQELSTIRELEEKGATREAAEQLLRHGKKLRQHIKTWDQYAAN